MTAMVLPAKPWTNGMLTADQRYYYDSTVGTEGAWRANPIPVGNVPAGTIVQWASNTIPANWLLCDGSAVSRTVYPSLFATIGTQYGVGDGSTTFNLPDLRGRVPVGKNGGTFGTLGATGGAETHTLTTAEMPSHNHDNIIWNPGYTAGAFNAIRMSAVDNVYTNGAVTGQVGNKGGGGAHNNLQPYQVTNYIIKATIGFTAGDSQLAVRTATLETNPVVSGNMSLGGNASIGGRVTAANQPAFLAQPTANNNASNVVGIFTSVTINTGNCYSTSTGRFTAPVAGSYMFTGSAMPQANTVMEFWRFRKNGVKIGPWTYAINGDQILTQTLVIPLAANDYVDLFFVSDGYEYLFTSFSGHLIG